MKVRTASILLLVLSAILFSCSSGDKKTEKPSASTKDGPGKIYWDDKSLKGEGNFKNFQKDGKWTLYHKGEKLKLAEGNYLNDAQTGLWTYFSKNGKKSTEGNFQDNQKTGKWIAFYDGGEKMSEANYVIIDGDFGKMGVPDGIKTTYYASGAIKMVEEFSKGVKKNKYQEFYESGKPKEISFFQNDKHNGKCNVYWENGKAKEQGSYKDDLRIGKWEFFFDNGQLTATGGFATKASPVKGSDEQVAAPDGNWQYFSKEGLLQKEGDYDKGKEKGMWKYYSYQNGSKKQVMMELTVTGGMAVGECKIYDNGKLAGSGAMTGSVKGIYKKIVAGNEAGEESYIDTPPDNPKANVAYKWNGTWLPPKKNGTWTEFYPGTNSKKSESTYMIDKINGKFKEYFQNGKIKAEGEYLNGKKNGIWKVYDENGSLNEAESGRWMMDKKSKIQ